jgi:hypothetical protein
MKTKCYCVGCKRHPLHDKRKELSPWVVGWEPDRIIFGENAKSQGAEVDCLEPVSGAFSHLVGEIDDYEYPITAYGDGCSITGFQEDGMTVVATCGNEDHEN